MAISPVNIALLLLTGVVALVMAIYLFRAYVADKKTAHLFWMISLLVLFVSGVLIILLGFEVLEEPLIPVIAALIPVGIATGLYYALWEDKNYGLIFFIYSLVVLVFVTLARLDIFLSDYGTILIMAIHVPSGGSIMLLPVYSAITNMTESASIYFSIGGLLISIGGMLLAFLRLSEPFLGIFDADTIFLVLPGLLLIVGAFFVLGMTRPTKWQVPVPLLN